MTEKLVRETTRALREAGFSVIGVASCGQGGHRILHVADGAARLRKVTLSGSPRDPHVAIRRVVKDVRRLFSDLGSPT